jgi:hypothetical protein
LIFFLLPLLSQHFSALVSFLQSLVVEKLPAGAWVGTVNVLAVGRDNPDFSVDRA